MKKLVNFHRTTQKSENFFSMGSFCSKYTRFELQKYRGVMFHDTEQKRYRPKRYRGVMCHNTAE